MISQDQRDFLKKIAKGIRDVMEVKGRDVKIAMDPMNDIEVFLSDEYIDRTTCCIHYHCWFSDELFIQDLDEIEETRLRELLFYFDYTGISFQEVVKYARVNESRFTSFEQFLSYSNDHTDP